MFFYIYVTLFFIYKTYSFFNFHGTLIVSLQGA